MNESGLPTEAAAPTTEQNPPDEREQAPNTAAAPTTKQNPPDEREQVPNRGASLASEGHCLNLAAKPLDQPFLLFPDTKPHLRFLVFVKVLFPALTNTKNRPTIRYRGKAGPNRAA
jgi:hypothetical protein